MKQTPVNISPNYLYCPRRPWLTVLLCLIIGTALQFPAVSEDVSVATEKRHLYELGVSSYYQGDYLGSIQAFQEILQTDPGDDAARLNLIQLLKETGDYENAASHLTYLSEKYPGEAQYRLALMETALLGGTPLKVLQYANESESDPEALFWLGLAFLELNKYEQAADFLEKSLTIQNFNPMTHFFLGRAQMELGRYQQAEASFKKALAQDHNLTICFYPLVQSYLAQQKYRAAYDLLVRAKSALPWNQTVATALNDLNQTRPEFEAEQRAAAAERRQISTPPRVKAITTARNLIPEVRIGLMEEIQRLYLKTGAEFRIAERNGTKVITGRPHTVLMIRQSGSLIEVCKDDQVLIGSSKPLLLSYHEPEATTILFDAQYGQGYFWAGRRDRVYRGSLEFIKFNQGLTVVNRVNVEEYLYSVVPSEIPARWPQAVLEAQAIAARTYTFANLGRFNNRGFDLLATVASQVYNGVESEAKSVTEAVDATRGMILTHDSKPISAFYYDNCGGHTESSLNAWGFSAPYLQAVPDKLLPARNCFLAPAELQAWLKSRPKAYSNHPNYSNRSAYRWSHWVTREEIENRLKLPAEFRPILSLTVVERSVSGRANKILIKGTGGEKTLKGDAIRSLGGLRSNLFVVQPKLGADGLPESFVFTGGGWGHGVGMAQSGAAGMAAAGYTAAEILAHYYQGAELTKKY